MLTRTQKALLDDLLHGLEHGRAIPNELALKIISTADEGTNVSKYDFRDFIINHIVPTLSDKELFGLTMLIMANDVAKGTQLLRSSNRLSGDLYKTFATRIDYKPKGEQPDTIKILNHLVYESMKDKSDIQTTPADAAATAIIFKLMDIPTDMTSLTREEIKQLNQARQEAVKPENKKIVFSSFEDKKNVRPIFKEIKKPQSSQNVFDLDVRLSRKLGQLETVITSRYKEGTATHDAATKILVEARKLNRLNNREKEDLVRVIRRTIEVLDAPTSVNIKEIENEAKKNMEGVFDKVRKGISSLVTTFRWNKHTTLVSPLSELAIAFTKDTKEQKEVSQPTNTKKIVP